MRRWKIQRAGKYWTAERGERWVDYPSTSTSVSNLAGVLQDQGNYEQTEEISRTEAGRVREGAWGESS
jgi:hypothetical protein